MRSFVIRTGTGGMEMFGEALDNRLGYSRVYIGKKVMRILRRLKGEILKSKYTGVYYRRVLDQQLFNKYFKEFLGVDIEFGDLKNMDEVEKFFKDK